MQDSLCLQCARFWKTCTNEEKRCFKGGPDGGLIRYCTGYDGPPAKGGWLEKSFAEQADKLAKAVDLLLESSPARAAKLHLLGLDDPEEVERRLKAIERCPTTTS